MSVLRIGDVTALYLLPSTKGLKNFKNWRKFPCYCGIVPVKYSSGISIIGISKVKSFCIKKMKSILHLASLSGIVRNAEIRAYCERKK